MKKKQYITPSSYCKMMKVKTYLISDSLHEASNGFTTPSGASKSESNSYGFANDRGFGSTYADEISTSSSIWDF